MKTPEEREALYDTVIAHKLLEIGKLCEENGMSMVCSVEWEPKNAAGARTVVLSPGSSFAIRMVYVALQAMGNIDSFLIATHKYFVANKIPNPSLYLNIFERQIDKKGMN